MRLKIRLPRWPQIRLGMRAKLVFSFLVVVFPAFALLAANDYRRYAERQQAVLTEGSAVGQAAVAIVQSELQRAIDWSRLALSVDAQQPAEAEAALDRLWHAGSGEYLAIFVLDPHGQIVVAAPAGVQPVLHAPTVGQLASSQVPLVSDLFLDADNQPVVQVLVPHWEEKEYLGAAGVTLSAQTMGSRLLALSQQGPYAFTLYDRQAMSIFSSLDPGLPWGRRSASQGANHVRQALQGFLAPIQGIRDPVDGQSQLGAALPIPETGWALAVQQPADGVLAGVRREAAYELGLFAVLMLLALGAAVSVGNWYAGPVMRLAQHARGLGNGRLNERITLHTGDEFEALAEALNGMARQMEERDRRLRARTAEMDSIITQSADGISIHGPAGELLRINPAGIRILGRSPSHLGLSLAEQATWFRFRTINGEPCEPSTLPVAAALRGETRVGEEFHVETEAGQARVVAMSASPLVDSRGHIHGVVSTFRDVTLAHQAQQEKDDFISVVSHELKTPITSIKGYAQMLLRRAEEAQADERDLKGLRIINDEVERMVSLINQLLDISRIEAQRLELQHERVDLAALVSDAVDRLQMTTSRHALRLRAPQQPVWIDGDGMRLAQVLGNLLMNAIQYSPSGGPIEVTLQTQEQRAWVSVRDWGIGIAIEDQPHVFQRFYRGTRKGSSSLTGMGLGLYISREIVQRHHGDIVFHSQPGQGTTFLFWLPLSQKQA